MLYNKLRNKEDFIRLREMPRLIYHLALMPLDQFSHIAAHDLFITVEYF